ncbi:gamma-glutamyl-gamma-aminobutyrate hydrolase family protein [Microbulbifer sp. OS29]|uniref:Gamma-glutamyl-gamma-aminobutyrate hydrolase family protein n=1 Tax=Microbulbifer okhotskensis TaxID=2926617 RepID=A0A9X2ETL1_9GAMM|nr:gamma-glutamyl-gamma-aminobutyrate hydrolase family protein [Microbulbifer okhotskensis]MCO1335573.1 gamma-glutamyl-gamma-aminobutyrate hydrolase family protein [Microbulbifer okhotskensis]
MKIGILKTDDVRKELVSEFGEYPEMFADLLRGQDPTLEFSTYEVQHGQYPSDIDDVDAYLITGSKTGVYDSKSWVSPLMDFVRKLHDQHKPTIGICFGHQLIAQALGGRAQKSDKGWGLGVHTYEMQETPSWMSEPKTEFSLLVTHQDQVDELPPGGRVLASSEFCPMAMVQVDDHMLSFQAHPEFSKPYSTSLMQLRREAFGEQVVDKGQASLQNDIHENMVAKWMLEFLRR